MKKIAIAIFLLSLIGHLSTVAQNLIAVQHGSLSTFYTTLDSAVVNSQSGDTIYLPGGNLNFGTITINKKLIVIGAGMTMDSTGTHATILNGGIYLTTSSDESSLCGFFVSSFQISNSVQNIQVSRCQISHVFLGDNSSSMSTGNVFFENILGNVDGSNTINNVFQNNIISGFVTNFDINNLFRNNIFLVGGMTFCYPGFWENYKSTFQNVNNAFFENNIILAGNYYQYYSLFCAVENNVFRNNLFVDNLDPNNLCPGCASFNNLLNQPQSTIFSNGYHLQETCPGKNAGTDGTDIGIYGGFHPWKEGSAPVNPHINFSNINNSTDLNGNLHVKIKVSAQDH